MRIVRGQRIRIRGTYGMQEFVDNYQSALAELQGLIIPKSKTRKLVERSFAWLIKQYFNSINKCSFSKITKRTHPYEGMRYHRSHSVPRN